MNADGVMENTRSAPDCLRAKLDELGVARSPTAQSVAQEGSVVDPVNWAALSRLMAMPRYRR